MNDATPRRLTGSLLERAAEIYDFNDHFRPRGDRPAPMTPPIAPPAASTARPPIAPAPFAGPVAAIDRELLSHGGFLVPGAPIGVLAEEFRLVKRHLLLAGRELAEADPIRSRMILVCSAKPGEGKTFCSINLALSMAAERDVEVLLVDADFAKPDVMRTLGLDEGPGLLDALGDPSIALETCVIGTDVPRLSLLPTGTRTTDDTELLASDRTDALLASLVAADPRRIVIFDSPPALAASPASVLAGQVGQVMMVVRADTTSETDLRESVALLDRCDRIQLLINAVSYAPGGQRYGTYYGHEDAQ
ncbi:exopolysaccharide biosynthesis protein [Sphingomonas koreensis]|nr:exopolysaccharide biosynthesis protein [Sphingomonas koreensis]